MARIELPDEDIWCGPHLACGDTIHTPKGCYHASLLDVWRREEAAKEQAVIVRAVLLAIAGDSGNTDFSRSAARGALRFTCEPIPAEPSPEPSPAAPSPSSLPESDR